MEGKKKSGEYVRLPGRGGHGTVITSGRCTLWMGADHLLLVESNGFTEDYKRFYFRDIKAILIRPRMALWRGVNWVLAASLAVFAVFFAVMTHRVGPLDRTAWIVAGVIVTAVFLVILLLSLFFGPTCACHLRTGVQQQAIPSLKRLKVARKALKKIRPAIEAVQGPFPEQRVGEIAEAIDSGRTFAGDFSKPRFDAGERMNRVGPPPLKPSPVGALPRSVLIAVLLFNAAAAFLANGLHAWTLGMLWGGNIALGVAVIVFLIRLRGARARGGVWTRLGIWGAWMLAMIGYWYAAQILYSMKHPRSYDSAAMAYSGIPSSFYLVARGAAVVFAGWAVVEAVLLFKERRGSGAGQPRENETAEVR